MGFTLKEDRIMPRYVDSEYVAKILAALGNSTRLMLVERLSKAETFAGLSISELSEESGLTRQAITKHLETLADAGLVRRFKHGRATWYELKDEPIKSAIAALTAVVKHRKRSQQSLKQFKESISLRMK